MLFRSRLEARDTATFLVDQDRHVGASDRIAQIGDEVAHLVRGVAIALKQDEAQRVGVAEKIALDRRQRRAGAAEDGCARLTA